VYLAWGLFCDDDYADFEDEPGPRSAAKLLTKDEARRIAPVLLRRTVPLSVFGGKADIAWTCSNVR
jgi:hypothetical protein